MPTLTDPTNLLLVPALGPSRRGYPVVEADYIRTSDGNDLQTVLNGLSSGTNGDSIRLIMRRSTTALTTTPTAGGSWTRSSSTFVAPTDWSTSTPAALNNSLLYGSVVVLSGTADTFTVTTPFAMQGEDGSTVEANPSGSGTTALTKVQIGGTIYTITGTGGGTTVEANPTDAGTEALTKITIGSTTYTIGGGSGDGKLRFVERYSGSFTLDTSNLLESPDDNADGTANNWAIPNDGVYFATFGSNQAAGRSKLFSGAELSALTAAAEGDSVYTADTTIRIADDTLSGSAPGADQFLGRDSSNNLLYGANSSNADANPFKIYEVLGASGGGSVTLSNLSNKTDLWATFDFTAGSGETNTPTRAVTSAGTAAGLSVGSADDTINIPTIAPDNTDGFWIEVWAGNTQVDQTSTSWGPENFPAAQALALKTGVTGQLISGNYVGSTDQETLEFSKASGVGSSFPACQVRVYGIGSYGNSVPERVEHDATLKGIGSQADQLGLADDGIEAKHFKDSTPDRYWGTDHTGVTTLVQAPTVGEQHLTSMSTHTAVWATFIVPSGTSTSNPTLDVTQAGRDAGLHADTNTTHYLNLPQVSPEHVDGLRVQTVVGGTVIHVKTIGWSPRQHVNNEFDSVYLRTRQHDSRNQIRIKYSPTSGLVDRLEATKDTSPTPDNNFPQNVRVQIFGTGNFGNQYLATLDGTSVTGRIRNAGNGGLSDGNLVIAGGTRPNTIDRPIGIIGDGSNHSGPALLNYPIGLAAEAIASGQEGEVLIRGIKSKDLGSSVTWAGDNRVYIKRASATASSTTYQYTNVAEKNSFLIGTVLSVPASGNPIVDWDFQGNTKVVGSLIEANPTGTSGTDLTRVKIDGSDYNLAGGGTDVEANPSDNAAAGDLTKLKIGSSTYSIAASGESGDSLQIIFRSSTSTPTKPADGAGTWSHTAGTYTPPSGFVVNPPNVPAGQLLYGCVARLPGDSDTETYSDVFQMQGTTGSAGDDGDDGDHIRLIFRAAVTAPATPTGGGWNYQTRVFTPPGGWHEDAPTPNDGEVLWASLVRLSGHQNSFTFHPPFKIQGSDIVNNISTKTQLWATIDFAAGSGAANPADTARTITAAGMAVGIADSTAAGGVATDMAVLPYPPSNTTGLYFEVWDSAGDNLLSAGSCAWGDEDTVDLNTIGDQANNFVRVNYQIGQAQAQSNATLPNHDRLNVHKQGANASFPACQFRLYGRGNYGNTLPTSIEINNTLQGAGVVGDELGVNDSVLTPLGTTSDVWAYFNVGAGSSTSSNAGLHVEQAGMDAGLQADTNDAHFLNLPEKLPPQTTHLLLRTIVNNVVINEKTVPWGTRQHLNTEFDSVYLRTRRNDSRNAVRVKYWPTSGLVDRLEATKDTTPAPDTNFPATRVEVRGVGNYGNMFVKAQNSLEADTRHTVVFTDSQITGGDVFVDTGWTIPETGLFYLSVGGSNTADTRGPSNTSLFSAEAIHLVDNAAAGDFAGRTNSYQIGGDIRSGRTTSADVYIGVTANDTLLYAQSSDPADVAGDEFTIEVNEVIGDGAAVVADDSLELSKLKADSSEAGKFLARNAAGEVTNVDAPTGYRRVQIAAFTRNTTTGVRSSIIQDHILNSIQLSEIDEFALEVISSHGSDGRFGRNSVSVYRPSSGAGTESDPFTDGNFTTQTLISWDIVSYADPDIVGAAQSTSRGVCVIEWNHDAGGGTINNRVRVDASQYISGHGGAFRVFAIIRG